MRGNALVFPVFVLYAVTIGRVSMTATDAALIALGERFEKLLLEHMDAWLEWAPRMRAAHAEVRDNMAALAVAIQHTGCDVAHWEALPANASHDGAFDFPDASRSLFDAVAEMIGLMPMVRELEARLVADVEFKGGGA